MARWRKGPKVQVNLRLAPDIKRALERLSRQREKPMSEIVEELVRREAERR